jgi:antitoxin component of MazEF toxin-antitoxin module
MESITIPDSFAKGIRSIAPIEETKGKTDRQVIIWYLRECFIRPERRYRKRELLSQFETATPDNREARQKAKQKAGKDTEVAVQRIK